MNVSLTDHQTRLLRLRSQRLAWGGDRPANNPAQVVKEVCGLQAQNPQAAALGVRVRSSELTVKDVDRALVEDRSIIRTWCFRGTLHLIEAEDAGWLIPLLGPLFIAGNHRRYMELGLDEELTRRGIDMLRLALARQGPLTRDEIVADLRSQGIKLEGQMRPHLLARAALEGLICLGPDRGAEPTYVLLEDWIGRKPTLPREAALAELAHRYLEAYSPARPEDLAAWSGLSAREARAGWESIADQLAEVKIGSQPAWLLKTQLTWLDELPAPSPVIRLLPWFDTYLLGYTSRDLVVDPRYAKRINPGGGMLHPTLLVDGRVLGTWNTARRRNQIEVLVEPFEGLPLEIQPALETEVSDLARFLGVKAVLRVTS